LEGEGSKFSREFILEVTNLFENNGFEDDEAKAQQRFGDNLHNAVNTISLYRGQEEKI
jgi:hypothetical protein